MKEYIDLIKEYYGLTASNFKEIGIGSGGKTLTFLIDNKKYVLKRTIPDGMNHPENEEEVCNKLKESNSKIKDIDFDTLTFLECKDEKKTNGKNYFKYLDYICFVYEYIEGTVYPLHSMNSSTCNKCASLLAQINLALKGLKLNEGINENFFKYMTPSRALASYKASLDKAINNKQYVDCYQQIIDYLNLRISLLEKIKDYKVETNKLTFMNSHGDYTNNQLVFSNDKIYVIDLTCACLQPVIWELVRFFFHSDKDSYLGFSLLKFRKYLSFYTKYIKLTDYEINNAIKIYFYQLLVCDYYSQYFSETDEATKEDYLKQANFSSEILKNNSYLLD